MKQQLLSTETSTLLIIDIQEKFLATIPDLDTVIDNTAKMIAAAVELDIPIIVSEQYPRGLGNTVDTIRRSVPADASVFEKTSFSCLGNSDLRECLVRHKRNQVIITGIETHICVQQTACDLLAAGFVPHIISDAVSSRHQNNKNAGLNKMHDAGAVISSVEIALFELLRDSSHPSFKKLRHLV
ncbi:MAG: hydrolase [Candidatus Auribacter fodinae]|jgi:nicotinamidase-related amidase|uniref:Hydrolase n=1 Tax=Candidatus Auribacter fodinae TaxID=2093366 RepID=A0A3A4QZX4_9BACT|nr:MAG: hydrolase [Candidatus Auribacter fodinae]